MNEFEEPRSDVDNLLVALLDKIDDSGSSVDDLLDDLCREHPEHAEDLRGSVQILLDTGLLTAPQADDARDLPDVLGDFELRSKLGAGGMAVVFLAEERSLGRQVALKILRPGELAFGDARSRFRREVAAASRLSHPGIVAVLSVGQESGIPFLAMEYVRGSSLERVLTALRDRRPDELDGSDLRRAIEGELFRAGEPGPFDWDEEFFAGSWSTVCLRMARRVAEALEHAHGRGVVHRDVKPSNVMVTPEGRVVLLDFGLAALAGADRLTRSHAELGSLPYLAPEQIEIGREAAGRRTDVYQLGVTLRELLTLESPFLDPESRERTRQRILAASTPPLRRLVADLSTDAEAVCRVAMERDPEHRYGSAGALAGDLTNVLAGRPVAARPAGTAVQLVRWVRRHRAAAVAVGLLALMVTVVPTAFAVREAHAKARIEIGSQRALEGYAKALDAIALLIDTASTELADVPMADDGRRALLEGAVAFLDGLHPQDTDDPGLRLAFASARLQVADIHSLLGRYDEALEEAAAIVEFLESDPSLQDDDGALFARARMKLGEELQRHGEAAAAELEALAALELLDEARDDVNLRLAARIELKLATFFRTAGREDEASARFDSARTAIERLAAEGEADVNELILLAGATIESGLKYVNAGRLAEAVEEFERGSEVCRRALTEDPDHRAARAQLVSALTNTAAAHFLALEYSSAEAPLAEAVELSGELVDRYPLVPDYHRERIGVMHNLAALRGMDGDDVRELLVETLAAQEELADRFQLPDDRWMIALILENVAAAHQDHRDYEEAIATIERYAPLATEALAVRPGDPNLQRCIRDLPRRRAEVLARLGRHGEAMEALAAIEEPYAGRTQLTVARVLASCGAPADADLALEHLERALDMGFNDPQSLRDDPLFASLHDSAEFEALVSR